MYNHFNFLKGVYIYIYILFFFYYVYHNCLFLIRLGKKAGEISVFTSGDTHETVIFTKDNFIRNQEHPCLGQVCCLRTNFIFYKTPPEMISIVIQLAEYTFKPLL